MKRSFSPLFLGASLAIAACLSVSSSEAALIAQQSYNGATFGFNDPFDDGTAVANLTYSTLVTSGSAMQVNPFGQTSSFSSGELTNNGTYYLSWLNQTSDTGSFRTLNFIASNYKDGNGPDSPTPFYGGGTGTNVAAIGKSNTNFVALQAGNYGTMGGVPGGTANSFQTNNSSVPVPLGVTNMYLVKVTQTPPSGTYLSTISVWFNPTTGDESALGAPLLSFTTQSFHLEQIQLFSNEVWDEIRVGTTIADVTPGLPVPEPTSVALIGLGLSLGLFGKRKRA